MSTMGTQNRKNRGASRRNRGGVSRAGRGGQATADSGGNGAPQPVIVSTRAPVIVRMGGDLKGEEKEEALEADLMRQAALKDILVRIILCIIVHNSMCFIIYYITYYVLCVYHEIRIVLNI